MHVTLNVFVMALVACAGLRMYHFMCIYGLVKILTGFYSCVCVLASDVVWRRPNIHNHGDTFTRSSLQLVALRVRTFNSLG